MTDSLVTVENCFKIYRDKQAGIETVALSGIDLQIRQGALLSCVGPSGSGKTTLLNVIGGLDEPSAGRVIYNISDYPEPLVLSSMDFGNRDQFRSRYIGFIFQSPTLMQQYTALENVQLPLQLVGKEQARKKAIELLKRLGLEHRLRSKPRQLSAGERQRVAVASALVFEPILLLGDEPTGELDSQTTAEVLDFLKEFHDENGTTMLLVTHNPNVAKIGQQILRLHDGLLMEHVRIEEGTIFTEEIDEYGRVTLPVEILEVLHYPEIVRFSGKGQKWRLFNATLRALDSKDIISPVDKKNRILLQGILGKGDGLGSIRLTINSPTNVELELKDITKRRS